MFPYSLSAIADQRQAELIDDARQYRLRRAARRARRTGTRAPVRGQPGSGQLLG